MDKRSAIATVNEHLGYRLLDGRNTSFANLGVNASKAVWWLNVTPRKFNDDLHLLLVKEGRERLIWLRIEANTFPVPGNVFRKRNPIKRRLIWRLKQVWRKKQVDHTT